MFKMALTFEYVFRLTIIICAIPSYISARIVSVDDWTQCPPPSSRFRVFTGVTVEQCAAECEARPACVTLGYLRHPHVCELFYKPEDGPVNVIGTSHCHCVNRENLEEEDGNPCGCPTWSVCDRKSYKCTIKECKPPRNVNNGTILGNRYDVGAKLRVKCDVGYYEEKDMTSLTCTESGNWSHVPSCVSKTTTTSIITPATATSTTTPTTTTSTITLTTTTSTNTPATATSTITPTTATSTITPATATSTITPATATSTITRATATSTITPASATNQKFDSWVDGQKKDRGWIFHDNTLMHTDTDFWRSNEPRGDSECVMFKKGDGKLRGYNEKECISEMTRVICERSVTD
ncbi:hypothetical protein MAR_011138 [Mya arenaria]|uniref:Sushi domain-containing protein n=1 Tax=Mya arenaria TaxID=6604 RepID=A0ABY7FWA6_MYAAR|nr:hypothetical protein MAR_011138 [Mya arenaria]